MQKNFNKNILYIKININQYIISDSENNAEYEKVLFIKTVLKYNF